MKLNKKGLQNILFIALAAGLAVLPLLMNPGAEFAGADGLAQEAITELRPGYVAWVQALWEPPSGEVESLLFALQAALGAGFIGYFLGSRKKSEKKTGNDHS